MSLAKAAEFAEKKEIQIDGRNFLLLHFDEFWLSLCALRAQAQRAREKP
jgi:hypothetical protein